MPKRLAADHRWIPDESVESNAVRVLPAMAREYFMAGRKLAAADPDPADLHPFRLKTKQIRYTLEGFQEVYGERVTSLLETLKPVQDALGDVNDCVATRAAFDFGRTFRAFLRRRAREKAKGFRKAWRKSFDLPGEEEKWVLSLSQAQPAVHGEDLPGEQIGSG
jgi:CHAD domain-containing protein